MLSCQNAKADLKMHFERIPACTGALTSHFSLVLFFCTGALFFFFLHWCFGSPVNLKLLPDLLIADPSKPVKFFQFASRFFLTALFALLKSSLNSVQFPKPTPSPTPCTARQNNITTSNFTLCCLFMRRFSFSPILRRRAEGDNPERWMSLFNETFTVSNPLCQRR